MTERKKTLIAGCLKGEKAAWDAFVQQYSDLVYHTIRKTLTLQHTDTRDEVVEDLYQEFFVSILRDECKKLRQFPLTVGAKWRGSFYEGLWLNADTSVTGVETSTSAN